MVPIKKVMLLLWRCMSLSMGSHEEINQRKSALMGTFDEVRPKCRQADIDDMKRRIERMNCLGKRPVALEEALRVLQANLHIPAAVLREKHSTQTGRTIRKVVGYELKASREHSSVSIFFFYLFLCDFSLISGSGSSA
jgi:hypothetical protein